MERYDFDRAVNRRGTDCYKYDTLRWDDAVSYGIADMDFETAPCITEALRKRLEHGCFGYTAVPEAFYESTMEWFARRHGWRPEREWFIYTSGVVPALSAIIKAMTVAGDKVLLQTPVYNCFFSSVKNNGCIIEEAPLVATDAADGMIRYMIDWEAFERACSDPGVTVFVLCNPHNPTGRVWTAEELRRMGEICQRHGVFVVSDEIHCEFVNVAEGHRFTPFMAVSDAPCAVCVAPSKAFNIAGLQIANIIIRDDSIRRRVDRAININEVCDVNPFGVIALQAAYTAEGEEWLTQLCDYIYGNYALLREGIRKHHPEWRMTSLEGTYLAWVDVSATGMDGDAFSQWLMERHHLVLNAGSHYGAPGKHFVRINLATQRRNIERLAFLMNNEE